MKRIDIPARACYNIVGEMSSIKRETLDGTKWAMINKCVMQPVNFVYFMVLARMITPGEMGVLGLTGLFFALANSLKEAGFGAALIRKQNRTEVDCSTVFWFNIAANVFMGLIFWLAAPWFAVFFNVPDLTWITRISCIMMVLGATQSVHYTLYTAKRNFKTPTIIGICTSLSGMPVTLYLAYTGWSYWSMVISGVFTGLVGLIVIWIVSPWKPRFVFSGKSFKEFFSFGYKLSLSSTVWTVYNEIINFVIGKFYSPSQLALYNRANHLAQLPATTMLDPLSSIMFPILSTIQDDDDRLREVYRKYLRVYLLLMYWIMFTIAASAESVILVLYGHSWLACSSYLQILCLGYMVTPLLRVNNSYLWVKGCSGLLLRREINVRSVGIVLMCGGAYWGVSAVCWMFVAANFYNLIITLRYSVPILRISVREQVRDLIPYAVLAALVNIPAFVVSLVLPPGYVGAFCGPLFALVAYVLILHYRKDDMYALLRDTLWESRVMAILRSRFRTGVR